MSKNKSPDNLTIVHNLFDLYLFIGLFVCLFIISSQILVPTGLKFQGLKVVT